ncbi:hypothetical protein [Xenorhabdus littoralis]|uniref:hypothetical protein n=1 Tax=Xenorhabdus littoralis TaxID=2582835 RepID=UPI0029E80A8D|nr:hypothetical protein [Xenorhabdus sp. psl]MDX7991109.1 hypothetical protein [Xenorhabdus sp. psl]
MRDITCVMGMPIHLTIKKQTYTVGLDKRFAVSKYNTLILFVETAYDDARSDNPAYKDKKQTILGTGARLSF